MLCFIDLCLAVAAENVNELMTNELFDVGSCGFEIFSRVELFGMFGEEFTNGAGKSETEVGVDIYLADCAACRFAELFFGNADCVGHLAAVFVYHLYIVLRNGGRAVENDREAGEAFFTFVENVETERRRNEDSLFVSGALSGGEFVCAVGSADSDGEGVASGLGNEFFDFFGTGVRTDCVAYFVFDSGKCAELCFDDYAVSMSIFNDFFGDLDVFFKGLGGSVDHNGGEPAVDAGFAGLEIGTVVEMENDGNFGAFDNSGFNELYKICVVRISACAFGNLEYNGSLFFLAGFGDTLDDLHIVYVESTYGVTAVVCFFEHFFTCYERHNRETPLFLICLFQLLDAKSIRSSICFS